MFFFFVGGIQPKRKVLEAAPRACPRCGRPEARLVRLDPYLSLFFIPLIPLGQGETALACAHCGYEGPPGGEGRGTDEAEAAKEQAPGPAAGPADSGPRHCPGCGAVAQAGHRFCPHCGLKF